MLLLDAEKRTQATIQDHFDALTIELLGVQASGLPLPRIRDLLKRGIIEADKLQGLDIAGLEDPLNPILFTRLIGRDYALASTQEREYMRSASLDYWKKQALNIKNELEREDRESIEQYRTSRAQPKAQGYTPYDKAIPAYFSEAEKVGLVSAFKSLGGFIRGLGNAYADEISSTYYEKWDKEDLLDTPNMKRREEALKVIREEVGSAVLTNDTSKEVASRIRQRTKDLTRNFERIAETELQATHNEGMIYEAVYQDGENARIARIPETDACKHCLRLFLQPNGRPRIFKVADLLANGTNVGVKARNYKPTAFPIHPNCRCDTIPVIQGFIIDKDGSMILESNET